MFSIRFSLPLCLLFSSLICAAQQLQTHICQRPTDAGPQLYRSEATPTADAGQPLRPAERLADNVQLVQIGVRHYSSGLRVPIWAVMLGDTTRAESTARMYRSLGPYGLNATLWTHTEQASGWARTTYRRPQDIDEAVAWFEDPAPFTSRQEGDSRLLPGPFATLASELIEKVDFIIRYDDGSGKAYLYAGTSTGDAERVVGALSGGD